MWAYVIRRLWQMLPTMLGVVLLVFILFNLFGGDPAYVLAGKISNPEQIDNIRRQLGVDRPYYVQLGIFLQQIVTGDFGASWSTNEQVSQILATRLGPSLTVLVPLLIIETIIAIGLALAVAYVRGSLTDRMVMIVCTVGLSISILVYIIVFQYVLRVQARLVPGAGLGQRLLGKPRQVRVAADPDRARRRPRAQSAAVPDVRARRDQPGLRAHRARQGRGRKPHHVGARAAQRIDPDHHARDGRAARAPDRRVPHRAVLLDPRHRPRSHPRRRALGLSRSSRRSPSTSRSRRWSPTCWPT